MPLIPCGFMAWQMHTIGIVVRVIGREPQSDREAFDFLRLWSCIALLPPLATATDRDFTF